MKESVYYVHPIGTQTNEVIARRLGQGGITAECYEKKIKGGGEVNVYECSSDIVEELYRSKKRNSLSFIVYVKFGNEIMLADASYLAEFTEETAEEVPQTSASHSKGRGATPRRKDQNALLA